MKKLTSLIAAAALLAACGADEDPAQKFREALPNPDAVQIGTPQAEGGGSAANALAIDRSALGDSASPRSEYATMSYYLAVTVNAGVGFTLRFLQYVTTFPPTSCDATSCTWGPWVDDDGLNRWKLNVQRVAEGVYDYTLAGQPGNDASAPFVTFIGGTARPVDRDHGSGSFTVDFDAHNGLLHGPLWTPKDFGRVAVTYDNTRDVSIGATFLDAVNDDPANAHRLNAVYAFEHGASGGVLQVAFENLDSGETVSLRTRWAPSGAGRADARYDPDGAGAAEATPASECWAGRVQDFAEVYDSKHTDIPELANESACSPFVAPDYADVVLP